MGNNTGITVAGAWGQFELNVFKPMLIAALLQSVRCLNTEQERTLCSVNLQRAAVLGLNFTS